MSDAPSYTPCTMRQPVWLYAMLALLAMFAIALAIASTTSGAGQAALQALAFPAAVGAGLTGGAVWGRLWRRSVITRREAIVRGVIAFSAVGFAWPAAFLIDSFLPGAGRAPTLAGMLAPLAIGAMVGAVAGLIAATAAAFIALTPSRP
ncbi:MAG: hypothetical protein JNJ73_02600 [Hyphomonadaceae bacterium]|nr:hypothetical protein [Hyphomonadaceae bacterium]